MKENEWGKTERTEHDDVLFTLILIARHNPRCFAYFVPFKLHRKQLRQVLDHPILQMRKPRQRS